MGQNPRKILPFRGKGLAQSPGSASNIDVSASLGTPAALPEDKLRAAVTRIVCHGTYRETRHSADDRSYRNISDDDIQTMLRGDWKLSGAPEWDDRHHNWKYKLTGADIEGDELTLIVAVNLEEMMITVITKF